MSRFEGAAGLVRHRDGDGPVRTQRDGKRGRRRQQLGFPVVLKVRADGITHKSDVGGVILGVQTATRSSAGFESIAQRLAERAPTARFVGVLVQKMVIRPQGRELIVGLTRDPNFGPVVTSAWGALRSRSSRTRRWPCRRSMGSWRAI